MVAQAPSGKKPLPDMMTSIRFTDSGEVEMVDQLLLPYVKGSFQVAPDIGAHILNNVRH